MFFYLKGEKDRENFKAFFYWRERATMEKTFSLTLETWVFSLYSIKLIIYNKYNFILNVDGIFDHGSQYQIY